VSEHLRTKRRLNPHIFPLLPKEKNIFSSPPSAFNIAKIAQFHPGMRKIWSVWWKGFSDK
jgi:hypothetical protein